MAIVNSRSTLATDPIRNFRFLVTFQPQDTGNTSFGKTDVTMGFTSVSGLAVTTDSIPYREGGYNTTVHQIPGQTSFTPLILQRGVMLGTSQNWNWMKQLFATVQANGSTLSTGKNFRCDLEIQVLQHPVPSAGADVTSGSGAAATATDEVAMRFKVYNAWPTTVAYSDLNAGDNALYVEQMTLVHEGFDLNWGSFTSTSGGGGTFTSADAFN
jgi:phage tail-like protein